MELSAVRAEISSHAELIAGLGINAAVVNEIDRHLKDVEHELNERLVHVTASVVVQNYLPNCARKAGNVRLATRVTDEIWNGFSFGKNWYNEVSYHEELSFKKCSKGYALYYFAGEVEFDLGVVECDGVDWYVRVIEDRRESHKVTGAPIEVKLRAFQHLTALLKVISSQTENLSLEPSF